MGGGDRDRARSLSDGDFGELSLREGGGEDGLRCCCCCCEWSSCCFSLIDAGGDAGR